jgi:hypothetical protein
VGDETAMMALAKLGLMATAAQSNMTRMIAPMRREIKRFLLLVCCVAVELIFMVSLLFIILQHL